MNSVYDILAAFACEAQPVFIDSGLKKDGMFFASTGNARDGCCKAKTEIDALAGLYEMLYGEKP